EVPVKQVPQAAQLQLGLLHTHLTGHRLAACCVWRTAAPARGQHAPRRGERAWTASDVGGASAGDTGVVVSPVASALAPTARGGVFVSAGVAETGIVDYTWAVLFNLRAGKGSQMPERCVRCVCMCVCVWG